MNSISRGIRNAFRNSIRTFSIVSILGLSIGLSLAMLIAHQAVGQKIQTVKASVGNTVSISPAGARGFEGGGNALTATQLAPITKLAHVTAVSESLNDRLTTDNTNLVSAVDAGSLGQRFSRNGGQSFIRDGGPMLGAQANGSTGAISFTPPVTVNGTTDPTNLTNGIGGGTFTLKGGKVFDGNSTANVALVGSTLATKNSLKVGSTFTAYSTTITVVGIFDAGNTFSNNQVLMPLATVQTLSAQAGAITSAVATVDSLTNVKSVDSAIAKQLGTAADVTNSAAQADAVVSPLQNIQTISLYSLVGSAIAGAAIILLTMVMIVRERRREIGVIKAIGASNFKVVTQFMSEAVTFTMLAAVIGIILGALVGNPITKMLVSNSTTSTTTAVTMVGPGGGGFQRMQAGGRGLRGISNSVSNIHAVVGWDIIFYGLGAALLIAVIGSSLAAFFIAKIRPAEVMRGE